MRRRAVRKTKRIVGEGQTEKAFLLFLRAHFNSGRYKVTPKSAGGKGPNNVIGEAIAEHKQRRYDEFCVFLDDDIPIPTSLLKQCRQKKISVIVNSPCIEATLLKIKGIRCQGLDTAACKRKFRTELGSIPTDSAAMGKLLTKQEVETMKNSIPALKAIIFEY